MVTRGRRDREGLRARLAARRNRTSPGSELDLGVQGRHLPAQVLLRNLSIFRRFGLHDHHDGPEEPADLQPIFVEVAEWLREESGIELVLDPAAFRRRRNRRGRPTTQGRIAYRGPNITRETLP